MNVDNSCGPLEQIPCRLVATVWSVGAPKWLIEEMFIGVGIPTPAVQTLPSGTLGTFR